MIGNFHIRKNHRILKEGRPYEIYRFIINIYLDGSSSIAYEDYDVAIFNGRNYEETYR